MQDSNSGYDERGLIKGKQYIFDEEGRVDWRKMVNPKFLVPNRSKTTETDIAKLPDSDLLIKLGGLIDLADIRGYSSLTYRPLAASEDFVSVICQIVWLPNFETKNQPKTFESMADAHLGNTEDFTKIYLTTIAENRAFVRCVRRFLKINVVSQEEVSSKNTEHDAAQKDLKAVLDTLMAQRKFSFEVVRDRLISERVPNAETFESTADIPKELLVDLVLRLTKMKN